MFRMGQPLDVSGSIETVKNNDLVLTFQCFNAKMLVVELRNGLS
jgi:hypothetical protein